MKYYYLKRIYLIMLILSLCTSVSYSQMYLGIRAEPLFYRTNIEKIIYQSSAISKQHTFESNINLSLSFSVKLSDYLNLSCRPGFILGNLYSGMNIGIIGNYLFLSNSYIITGINTHIRKAWGGHTYSGNDITTPYLIIVVGKYLTNKISGELQFNYPLNKQIYGTYREMISSYTVWYNYNVAWMFKLSIGYDIEI